MSLGSTEASTPRPGSASRSNDASPVSVEARDALAEIGGQAAAGMFVPRVKSVTVGQVCADYLAGRHNLRESARAKLEYDLGP